jgi:hypothetical protein
VGPIKGLLSQHIYSKWESWKAALCLTETGQKAARQRKSTTDKKKFCGSFGYGSRASSDNNFVTTVPVITDFILKSGYLMFIMKEY